MATKRDSDLLRDEFQQVKLAGGKSHVAATLARVQTHLNVYRELARLIVLVKDAGLIVFLVQNFANWQRTLDLSKEEVAAPADLENEIKGYLATMQ
jgi:hypothetical protein